MQTIWSFDHIKNKHILYRGKDYMKKFSEALRQHAEKKLILKRKKCYH